MKKEYILITGATGFIGSYVTDKLLSEKKYQIIAIVRETSDYKNVNELSNKGVFLFKGDFFDKTVVEKVFDEFPVKYVIHAAALRGGGAGSKKDYLTVNVKGTEVLLNASHRHNIERFIFISSVGVFGTIPSKVPAGIDTTLVGDSAYHKSKILSEQMIDSFVQKGLDVYTVRPAITYGSGDDGFPMTLVKLVKDHSLIQPFKDIKIHLLDVNSLAELISMMLITACPDQRVFIAADKKPVSVYELVNIIHQHYYQQKMPSLINIPNFIYNIASYVFKLIKNEKWLTRIQLISQDWYYDIQETEKAFGFSPVNTNEFFIRRMGL